MLYVFTFLRITNYESRNYLPAPSPINAPSITHNPTMRTLAHLSDLHFGRDDPAVAEALIADLANQQFDILVNSGDFTQRARASQYRAAAGYMRRLPTPRICVPGNHDIPLYDIIRRFFFPLHRYEKYITNDIRPFYQDDELAILGINTARSWTWTWNGFWKDGRISTEQLLDVETRLGHLPESIFKIVVTHHPFIPPPKERIHGIVGAAFPALEMMQKSGVDMLLAGHLHLGYSGDVRTHHEGIKRSILSVQAGTAISTRHRLGEPNAYNLITVSPELVILHVRTFQNGSFNTRTITHFSRRDDAWRQETPAAP